MNKSRQKHTFDDLSDQESKQWKKQRGPELLEFDSVDEDIRPYAYSGLPPERNRIRLLRLFAGVLDNPQINCEMFEAEFDGNGVLRRIGNDGPTSTRLKSIFNRSSIGSALGSVLPDMVSIINSTQSDLPTSVGDRSQDDSGGNSSQDDTSGAPQSIIDNQQQENGGNPTQENGSGQVQGEVPQPPPLGSADQSPPMDHNGVLSNTNEEVRQRFAKLEGLLEKLKLIDFSVVGDVLNDTIMPQFGPDDAPLDDILDSKELKKVLSEITLKDIVDIGKLDALLNSSEQDNLQDVKLQRVLNEVKLEEVLKSARLGEPIPYEALSWRWGDEDKSPHTIMIKRDGFLFKKRVSKTLGLALKYLRLKRDRILWIDAICINQKNLEERSFQVSLMALVYTGAEEICVWLGEDDDDSTKAIRFIKDDISQLKDFDKLCTDKQHSPKWKALLVLMQRAWFSRRWVVQEIALAAKAQVYCGPDQISWVDLAIAVELFVEVETATHRLSELMKKDDVVPYWFEHVSELGASVLVSATARVFRQHRGGGYGPLIGNSTGSTQNFEARKANRSTNFGFTKEGYRKNDFKGNYFTKHGSSRHGFNKQDIAEDDPAAKGPLRRSLLSLEYLVTSLSIFDCGRPHDSIYALIAIARDAAPHPPSSLTRRTKEALIAEVFSDALEQKPYPLDYNSPYPDVCKEFLHFCIKGAAKADKVQALDILCRPWAKDWRPNEYVPEPEQNTTETGTPVPEDKNVRILKPKTSWEIKRGGNWEKDSRTMKEYFENAEENFHPKYLAGADEKPPHVPASRRWFKATGCCNSRDSSPDESSEEGEFQPQESDNLALPSWVTTIAGASFDIFPHPGMDMVKMGRKNADPLVGVPQDGRRNYSACQLKGVDIRDVKFRRRARLGYYSLYVKGFCFDRVQEVSHVSQAGTIPSAWLDLAGWTEARRTRGPSDEIKDPPNEFWRTLVADRGMHNQNPPYYYMRACKETIMKGGLRSNAVDTSALIYNERNSIVAEFCRRVQAVIWNRAMIRTEQGNLGLVSDGVRKGDWVCLIYGCTVPVILRKNEKLKSQKEYDREKYEDCIEAFAQSTHRAAKNRFRKARYQELKEEKSDWEKDVKDKLAASSFNKPRVEYFDFEDDKKVVVPIKDTEEEEEKWDGRENEGDENVSDNIKQRRNLASKMDPFRHYRFIGEAYIHGMMDGEAVRQKFYKGKPDHIFELR